jgi:hypothetical protein
MFWKKTNNEWDSNILIILKFKSRMTSVESVEIFMICLMSKMRWVSPVGIVPRLRDA